VRRLCRRAYRPDCRIFLDLSRPWRPHYRQGFQRLRHLVVLGPFFETCNNARELPRVVDVECRSGRRFTLRSRKEKGRCSGTAALPGRLQWDERNPRRRPSQPAASPAKSFRSSCSCSGNSMRERPHAPAAAADAPGPPDAPRGSAPVETIATRSCAGASNDGFATLIRVARLSLPGGPKLGNMFA
jgi:hypothetical protein